MDHKDHSEYKMTFCCDKGEGGFENLQNLCDVINEQPLNCVIFNQHSNSLKTGCFSDLICTTILNFIRIFAIENNKKLVEEAVL